MKYDCYEYSWIIVFEIFKISRAWILLDKYVSNDATYFYMKIFHLLQIAGRLAQLCQDAYIAARLFSRKGWACRKARETLKCEAPYDQRWLSNHSALSRMRFEIPKRKRNELVTKMYNYTQW